MSRDLIGSLFIRFEADVDPLRRQMTEAEQTLSRSGQRMQQTGRTMTRRLTAPLLALGGAALKVGMDFETSMLRVQALSGATAGEFAALEGKAKELGATTQFSASQAADALGFLSMAGFRATESVEALPGVLQLAAAAGIDLASAADIASNVLTGFGLEVSELERVNDVLAMTMTSTNTNLEQLAEAMKYAAPVAASVGAEIEEVAAAIGLMGNAGIQGSMAGTSMRAAMARMVGPTKQVSAVMERLGMNVLDSSGQLVGMVDIVRQLEETGADTADMMTLFGLRAGPAMAALVSQGSDALQEQLTRNLESSGKAAEIAETQMSGMQGTMFELRSAAEAAGIALAESGILDWAQSMAGSLAGLFRALAETNPELLTMGVVAAGLVAAAGPLLFLTGSLMRAWASMGPVLRTVSASFGRFHDALAAGRLAGVGYTQMLSGVVTRLLQVAPIIGAVVIAWRRMRDRQADVAASSQALVAQLEREGAAVAEVTREWVRSEVVRRDISGSLGRAGIPIDLLTDAYMGVVPAQREVNRLLEENRTAWDGVRDAVLPSSLFRGLASESSRLGSELGVMGDSMTAAAEASDYLSSTQTPLGRALADTAYAASNLTPAAGGAAKATSEAGNAASDAMLGFEGLDEVVEEVESAFDLLAPSVVAAFEALSGGFSAMSQYQENLRAINDANRAAAEATAAATEDQADSWNDYFTHTEASFDAYIKALEQTLIDQREWAANLNTIREAAGNEYADMLAAQGPEFASLHAEIARQERDEIRRGAALEGQVRREAIAVGVEALLRSTPDWVDAAGRVSEDTIAEMAAELGVMYETVENAVNASIPVLEASMDNLAAVAGIKAAEVVGSMIGPLNLVGPDIARIAGEWSAILERGLDPVLTRIRDVPTVIPGGKPSTGHSKELFDRRAQGGPVLPGRATLVGEEGPELVTFGAPGMVHTAAATEQMLGGSSTQTAIELHVHYPKPETASDTVPRALDRLSMLGYS